MVCHPESEQVGWESTAQLLGNFYFSFGEASTCRYKNEPIELVAILSRYKFAAKMSCKKGTVLEIGCEDGIGATILGEFMERYVGVDTDEKAIQDAKDNLDRYGRKFSFICDDFLGKKYGMFSAVVSLGVLEKLREEQRGLYFDTVMSQLMEDGICVIGTAGEAKQEMIYYLKGKFHQVFHFGMNEEMMTAAGTMASYVVAVACHKKDGYA